MTLIPFNGVMPRIHPDAFIAPNAVIIGDVEIGAHSSIWYGCILRGDVNFIRIGAGTNIQDGTVIHVASPYLYSGCPTIIGDDVTVGHMALIHAATLQDGAFVGMKACVMDGAVVSTGAVLAAGGLLTPNKIIPGGELWGGNPARKIRDLSPDEIARFAQTGPHYRQMAAAHRMS